MIILPVQRKKLKLGGAEYLLKTPVAELPPCTEISVGTACTWWGAGGQGHRHISLQYFYSIGCLFW